MTHCRNHTTLLRFAVVLACLTAPAGCSRYQPSKDVFVGAPSPQAGAPRPADSTALDVPPLPPPTSPFNEGAAVDSEPDLPANPAIWGETAERAAGRRFDPIYFDFDSSELRPQSRRALEEYAEWLGQNPGVWVTLEGHCDKSGSAEYNYNLGMLRAIEVRMHLASLGTSGERVFMISYGEERPAVEETSPEAEALNRRVEIHAFRAPPGDAAPPTPTSSGAPPELKDPAPTRPMASDLP